MEIIATRKDFIDEYVGWSFVKTTKFLEENINNKITIEEGSLCENEHDCFGFEAIGAIKEFDGKINFSNEQQIESLFEKLDYKLNSIMEIDK